MPTWLIILLCLPLALWLAYCVLRSALGSPLCAHCVFSWFMAPVALGLWLVYSGLNESVEAQVVVGATLVITACIVGGIVAFALHLAAKRKRERQRRLQQQGMAAADAAILAGAAALAASGVGGRQQPDAEPGGDAPDGPDLDIGLDI